MSTTAITATWFGLQCDEVVVGRKQFEIWPTVYLAAQRKGPWPKPASYWLRCFKRVKLASRLDTMDMGQVDNQIPGWPRFHLYIYIYPQKTHSHLNTVTFPCRQYGLVHPIYLNMRFAVVYNANFLFWQLVLQDEWKVSDMWQVIRRDGKSNRRTWWKTERH